MVNKYTDTLHTHDGKGRPSAMDAGTVTLLLSAFASGASVTVACHYAKISRKTFYAHYNNDEDFSNKINDARDLIIIEAHNIVKQKIVTEKDLETAKWWILHRDPEFMPRGILFGVPGQPLEGKYEPTTDGEIISGIEELFNEPKELPQAKLVKTAKDGSVSTQVK